MGRLLAFLGGHGVYVLFGGVFIGLLLPGLASLLRPLLAPAVFVLLLATLLRVDWRAMADFARKPALVGLLTLWLMILAPLLTWLAIRLTPTPEALATAVVLMAAAPPILAATSIALLLGLDSALAVVTGLICTLLAPLSVPPLALALLGLELEIGVAELMLRLGVIVVGAFLGAGLLRRLLGLAWLESRAAHLDGLIMLVLLIFAISIMDGVTDTLLTRPGTVALWLAAAFLANPLLQLAGSLAFFWLGLRRALTVGILSGNCNMGLLLAALPPDAGFDIVLFFAIAQIPMYMLPAMLLPIYRRLLARRAALAGDGGTPGG